ncbi:MAG: DciA family protein [Boseongicola sp.]|nr:DciA family protein [Boseongicola sp.]
MKSQGKMQEPRRRERGFERASGLVAGRVRAAGEHRGFAVSRLLTHWTEVAGPDIARVSRPVEVTYGRGLGATLTLLTTGPEAPMLEMQKDKIRERVNACYGYGAIEKIRITQTAATGFGAPDATAERMDIGSARPVSNEAREAASEIRDEGLRKALERLGSNVLFDDKHK